MPSNGPLQPPALLLAASSPRSGSTLLQRYITAATDVFMWGENGRLIPSLRRVLEEWPQEPHNLREHRDVMADPSLVERKFVPNLAPLPGRLLDVLRDAVESLYRKGPDGFARWGWKAVDYGRREVEFVRALFPSIDVLLLVRNPWDVARSIRRKGWIDKRAYFEDVAQVATLWTERSAFFRELAAVDDPHVHLVQYEALEGSIREIDHFLGVDHQPPTWERISRRKLGTAPTISRFDLTDEDVETIASVAGDVARDFGYWRPSPRLALFGVPL